MYSLFNLSIKYLTYYFKSSNGRGHGTHSPFIFHFIKNVLNNDQPDVAYAKVESLRKQLLKDRTALTIEDFGAGSKTAKNKERTVANIASSAAKSKKFGQLLFRMVKTYQSGTILELGTSLGITTSYLSLANPNASVITLEGAAAVANCARQNFQSLGLQNITLTEGNFDNTLDNALRALQAIDFAFIDGNHRQEPTERYFQQLLTCTHNDSILIFDDIHWSREMEIAWQNIQLHPSVTCSVDLFFIGIIFLRKEFLEKQHFSIRF